MDARPVSHGEALQTQTFLGHPPSCAAALACLEVLEQEKLVERAARSGEVALALLRRALPGSASIRDVRGLGLMIGVECDRPESVAFYRAHGFEVMHEIDVEGVPCWGLGHGFAPTP